MGFLGVGGVVESTGVFGKEKAGLHLEAGAGKVVISAPAKGEQDRSVRCKRGHFDHRRPYISNASCTTNYLAPMVKVLDDEFGVVHGLITCIRYTADQRIRDAPHRAA